MVFDVVIELYSCHHNQFKNIQKKKKIKSSAKETPDILAVSSYSYNGVIEYVGFFKNWLVSLTKVFLKFNHL